MARSYNPFAFSAWPVTFFTVAVYLALLISLLHVHLIVPKVPKAVPEGISLESAWGDLQQITAAYHPYNSRANDDVRKYLLERIHDIINKNAQSHPESGPKDHLVSVIEDNISNATFSNDGSKTSIYFEGTNLMVLIRGSEAESLTGTVLVNAHYDSVSTGYGATDDGVGVVSVLQLLSYFLTHPPKRSVVLLLNNGEEDYLNGARAFMRHPISSSVRTFVNLEGAGAGGRAILFRSTDLEVVKQYTHSPHPFGNIVSGDGFKRKLIRSETDYAVFNGNLGLRGLDIAFMEPRSMYHTLRDSTRDTSLTAVWHMLSAAIQSAEGLALDASPDFDNPAPLENPRGTPAVWFDLFGKTFVSFSLRSLFIFSVIFLIIPPIIIIFSLYLLTRSNKAWLLSRKLHLNSVDEQEPLKLYGWRGVFRFPITFAISTGALIGISYLIAKVNPYIAYSSPYAVWSMLLGFNFFLNWFFLRGSAAVRPSALHRFYALLWIYIGTFALAVIATVAAHKYEIGGSFLIIAYHLTSFVALWFSILELYFLPTKDDFANQVLDASQSTEPLLSDPHRTDTSYSDDRQDDQSASLLRNDRQTFARYGTTHRPSTGNTEDTDADTSILHMANIPEPYKGEQLWSGTLPSWMWLPEFLVLGPINIVLLGQVGLLLTSALYQTLADGNSALNVYLCISILACLLIAPLGPFIHRYTYQIPSLIFAISVATLVYNLTVFPFSSNNSLKVYFVQQVDCDTAITKTQLIGLDPYVKDIIHALPSAHGQDIDCDAPGKSDTKLGLTGCSWPGIMPHVAPFSYSEEGLKKTFHWVSYNMTRVSGKNKATISVQGKNTRACRIQFKTPITDFSVEGAGDDDRFKRVGEEGSTEIRLWHREWDQPWLVHVSWGGKELEKLEGRVLCLWSDANTPGLIPSFDEVVKYRPSWAIISKSGDGLVEGYRNFTIAEK